MQLVVAPFKHHPAGRGKSYLLSAEEALVAKTGRVTVITGDSGAGKSTLLQVLAGERPAGKLCIEIQSGEDTEPIPLASFLSHATRLAYLPQQSVLRGTLTPYQAIRYWFSILTAKHDSSFIQKATEARDWLEAELFDETERAEMFARRRGKAISRLSGGQQRRLDVLMTLCSPAELVLLDEPDTGLDPPRRKQLFKALTRFAERYGKIIIVVSHYAAEAFDAEHIDTWIIRRTGGRSGSAAMGECTPRDPVGLNLNQAPPESHDRRLKQFWIYTMQQAASLQRSSLLIYLAAPVVFMFLIRLAALPYPVEDGYAPQLAARKMVFFYAVTCYWLGLVQSTGIWVGHRVLFRRECRQGASSFAYLGGVCIVFTLLAVVQAGLGAWTLKAGASGLKLGAIEMAGFGTLAAWNGLSTGWFWATLQQRLFPATTSPANSQLLALLLTLVAIVFSYQVIGEDNYKKTVDVDFHQELDTPNRLALRHSIRLNLEATLPQRFAITMAEWPWAANTAFHGLWFQGEWALRTYTGQEAAGRQSLAWREVAWNLILLTATMLAMLFTAWSMVRSRAKNVRGAG